MTDADASALLRRLEILEAKEEIRDVLYRYCRGCDRSDVELLRSCYHPGAKDVHWVFVGDGHEFAADTIAKLGTLPNRKHYVTNPLIDLDLDGDRAFVESSYFATQRIPLDDGTWVDVQSEGRYLDVFERRGGEWRIGHRHMAAEKTWMVEGERAPVVGGAGRAVPDERQRSGDFPHDPVYRGYDIVELMPPEFRTDDDLFDAIRAHVRGRRQVGAA